MEKKLINHLKKLLDKNNFLDLYTFLKVILYDEEFGFYKSFKYKKNELIGKEGHFITGPETSQLFGELIGIWILQLCENNKFNNINLMELGPGRGTLMNDILRVFSNYKKNIRINIHLLEFSEVLKAQQQEVLKNFNYKLKWYKNIFKIKHQLNDDPIIIISNEFFDCLPINQYTYNKSRDLITKKIVRYHKNKFYFDDKITNLNDIPFRLKKIQDNLKKINKDIIIEYSPLICLHINEICEIIKKNNGANLLIDYGKDNPYGDTLQSVYKNQRSDLFDNIGESDYSCLVDFDNIMQIVKNNNLQFYPIKSQREFFIEMGINKRIEDLSLKANQAERRDLLSGYERLVSKRHMGDIFKVFCFSNKNLAVPIFKL